MLITSAVSWALNCERVSRGDRHVPILSYPIYSVALHLQTWSPEYRAENTLQSDNPKSYFINAYIFMTKTTFIRWFLASICVVIWIYFVYFSPWRVRIWRKDLVNKGTSFAVILEVGHPGITCEQPISCARYAWLHSSAWGALVRG